MRGFHNIISRKVPKEHSRAAMLAKAPFSQQSQLASLFHTQLSPIYQVYGINYNTATTELLATARAGAGATQLGYTPRCFFQDETEYT